METQRLPTAGADRRHMASLLPLGSLRGTQLPETRFILKGPASIENIAKFLLCHSLSKHGASDTSAGELRLMAYVRPLRKRR